jgi:hypothetical protein
MVKCISEKLLVRPHDLIFMKEHVPEKFVFGKPFFMNAQLSKRPFPLRRLYNWYMMASSLSVTNIAFEMTKRFMSRHFWWNMNPGKHFL